jgi:hypothetical protein
MNDPAYGEGRAIASCTNGNLVASGDIPAGLRHSPYNRLNTS